MKIFQITVRGEGIIIPIDGKETECGFYKNEYLWARNSEAAVAEATRRSASAISSKASKNSYDIRDLKMTVEDVHKISNPLKLIRSEGFVFYPVARSEENDSQ